MDSSISVIIVNYNAGPMLVECVRSVEETDLDLEIIVVDNASSDGSVEELHDKFQESEALNILNNKHNLGFAVACNQGIRKAVGEYLFFLNPDCHIEANTIPVLLEELQSDALVGMVGGLILNRDGSEQRGCRREIPTPWKSFVNSFGLRYLHKSDRRLFKDFRLDSQPLPETSITVEAISGACMLVKREAVKDVGLMDEGYFLHCEDLDWCKRFRQKGWDIRFVPHARLTHEKGTCSASRPLFVELMKHKGMVRFHRKFFKHRCGYLANILILFGIWVRFCVVVAVIFGSKLKLIGKRS